MLGSFFDIPIYIIYVLFAFAISLYVFLIFFNQINKNNILFFALLFVLLGYARLSMFEQNIISDKLHNFYNQKISLSGIVLGTELKQNSQRVIADTDLGKTLIVTNLYPRYKYGDILSVSGVVKEPEPYGDYDTKKILARDNIYSEIIFLTVPWAPRYARTILFASKKTGCSVNVSKSLFAFSGFFVLVIVMCGLNLFPTVG